MYTRSGTSHWQANSTGANTAPANRLTGLPVSTIATIGTVADEGVSHEPPERDSVQLLVVEGV